MLKKLIKTFLALAIAVILGYLWCYSAIVVEQDKKIVELEIDVEELKEGFVKEFSKPFLGKIPAQKKWKE